MQPSGSGQRIRIRSFPCVSALVSTSFSEGICPDLIHVAKFEDDGDEKEECGYSPKQSPSCSPRGSLTPASYSPRDSISSSREGSMPPDRRSSLSPFRRDSSTPPVRRSSLSPSRCEEPVRRRNRFLSRSLQYDSWDGVMSTSSSPLFSPLDSDCPDSAFKTTPKQSKHGFFSFSSVDKRRCSVPVVSARRGSRVKADAYAVAEGAGGRGGGVRAKLRKTSHVCFSPVRIVVSISGDEGGSRLKRCREFGSTGDLLDGTTKEKSKPPSFHHHLGGSLEQVSRACHDHCTYLTKKGTPIIMCDTLESV